LGEITEALRRSRPEGERESRPPAPSTATPSRRLSGAGPSSPPRILEPVETKPQVVIAAAPAAEPARDEVSLFDVIGVVLRHQLLAATIFLTILGSVTVGTFMMTPIYESTAILLVKLGREFKNVSDGSLSTPVSQVINTEVVILRSDEVIESVVAALGPEVLYPGLLESQKAAEAELASAAGGDAADVRTPLALATRRFANNLRVEGLPDTQVIQVSFQHPDPQLAADAVNLLVDRFQERHLWAFSQAQATAFLEEKVGTHASKLEQANDRLRAFLETHAGFAIADIGDVVGRERRELAAQIETARSESAAMQRELSHLETELAGTSRYEAGDRRTQLELRIQEVKAQLKGLIAREATLRQSVSKSDAELAELPALRKRYDSLVRERDSAARLYENYSMQLEEARVSAEMDRQKIANIAVLQAGMAPTSPVRPRKALNLAVGGAAAAAVALLGALLVEAAPGRQD
jgi:uncharacterized protein involved in exopolysaccharide biosynthesis